MSNKYELKNKEEQDRLIKDLEDAKSAEEKRIILMKYEEDYIQKIKLLQEQNEQLKRDLENWEVFYDNIYQKDWEEFYNDMASYYGP